MENIETKEEFKLSWKDVWTTLKVGFIFAIGFNIGDLVWLIVSKIAALI